MVVKKCPIMTRKYVEFFPWLIHICTAFKIQERKLKFFSSKKNRALEWYIFFNDLIKIH